MLLRDRLVDTPLHGPGVAVDRGDVEEFQSGADEERRLQRELFGVRDLERRAASVEIARQRGHRKEPRPGFGVPHRQTFGADRDGQPGIALAAGADGVELGQAVQKVGGLKQPDEPQDLFGGRFADDRDRDGDEGVFDRLLRIDGDLEVGEPGDLGDVREPLQVEAVGILGVGREGFAACSL